VVAEPVAPKVAVPEPPPVAKQPEPPPPPVAPKPKPTPVVASAEPAADPISEVISDPAPSAVSDPAPSATSEPTPVRAAAVPAPEPAPKPAPAAEPTPEPQTAAMPALLVEKTKWHPRADRRSAWLRVGEGAPREVVEGDVVEGVLVAEIQPSGVVFDRDGEQTRRGVGER
jgi:hypothetical protein